MNNNIAERFKQARKLSGHTRESLACAVHTDVSSITKIETGGVRQPRNIERYGRILGVNPAWLQFGDPNPRVIPGYGG
ncbi:MAG: helix-turn-helix transcriptional regulator [Hyphomicrobiaceae bacterium]|nr:helix-turn-helix transcriptional regulator [Hyphomicrobiaceae bacterium]